MSVKPFSGKHISFLGVNCLWPIWYKLGPMWSVADIVVVPMVPIECVRYFAVRWPQYFLWRCVSYRDWNPGFEKPGYPGNLDILPNPKPGFGHLLNPRVSTFFGFAFLHLKRCILMEYYITLRVYEPNYNMLVIRISQLTELIWWGVKFALTSVIVDNNERRKHSSSNASSARRERTYRVLLLLRITLHEIATSYIAYCENLRSR